MASNSKAFRPVSGSKTLLLRRFPPEIKELIFKEHVLEWIQNQPHHHSRQSINAGYFEKYSKREKRNTRCPALERALIGDKGLWREFFAVRIKLQTIRVDITESKSLIRNQSDLARPLIRGVELNIRPFKSTTDWPAWIDRHHEIGYMRADHVVNLATTALLDDILIATSLRHLRIKLSASLYRLESFNWEVMELVRKHLLTSGKLEDFIMRSRKLETLHLMNIGVSIPYAIEPQHDEVLLDLRTKFGDVGKDCFIVPGAWYKYKGTTPTTAWELTIKARRGGEVDGDGVVDAGKARGA